MTLFFSETDELSNWFMASFELKGVRFNCVEQTLMFAKAKLFGDDEIAGKIMAAPHPRLQKALGRGVARYNDDVWAARRSAIATHACYAKFSQNPGLRDVLLATADTVLVEASPYDPIWGVGLAEHDPRVLVPQQWKGQNLLGQVLTSVRARLNAEPHSCQATETTSASVPRQSLPI